MHHLTPLSLAALDLWLRPRLVGLYPDMEQNPEVGTPDEAGMTRLPAELPLTAKYLRSLLGHSLFRMLCIS